MRNSSVIHLSNTFSINKEVEKENILSIQKIFLTKYYEPLLKNINIIENKYNFKGTELTSYLYYKFCIEYFQDFKNNEIPIPEQLDFEHNNKVHDVISFINNNVPELQLKELWSNITQLTSFVNFNRVESGLITKETFNLLSKKDFYLPIFENNFLNPVSFSIYIDFQYPKLNKLFDLMLSIKTNCLRNLGWGIVNQNNQSLLNHVKCNPDSKKYSIKNCWYISKGLKDNLGNYIFVETTQRPTKEAINIGFATKNMPEENKPSIIENSAVKDEVPIFVSGKKVIIKFMDENTALRLKNQTQKKSYFNFKQPSIPKMLKPGFYNFKNMDGKKIDAEGGDFSDQSLEMKEWKKHLKNQRKITLVFLIIFSILFFWYGENGRYETVPGEINVVIDTKTGKIYYERIIKPK
ncbi:hypothetical protein [Cyclobacterium sp.]|uniref:hypothetical protein n=1 Tax=Cyclobacterium sp. TaxID=1966343 RepID=UPI0019B739F9|nr:hypothetical protein [Cyclobacterium sp.]MBD3627667.1 hypothetical protein [Cyclobacterium sp.]